MQTNIQIVQIMGFNLSVRNSPSTRQNRIKSRRHHIKIPGIEYETLCGEFLFPGTELRFEEVEYDETKLCKTCAKRMKRINDRK